MFRRGASLALVVSLALLSGAIQAAQEQGSGPEKGNPLISKEGKTKTPAAPDPVARSGKHRELPGTGDLLKQMDANKDGQIGRDEAQSPLARIFDRVDANADDALDKEELREWRKRMAERIREGGDMPGPGRHGEPGEHRPEPGSVIEKLDENKDGKISRQEVKGRLAEHFEHLDANSDGSIDLAELKKMREQRAESGEGGPFHGPLAAREGEGGSRAFQIIDADGDDMISEEEFNSPRARLIMARAAGPRDPSASDAKARDSEKKRPGKDAAQGASKGDDAQVKQAGDPKPGENKTEKAKDKMKKWKKGQAKNKKADARKADKSDQPKDATDKQDEKPAARNADKTDKPGKGEEKKTEKSSDKPEKSGKAGEKKAKSEPASPAV